MWRRISDNGNPQSLLGTAEMLRVISGNAQIRTRLKLPKELKPTYSNAAKDICIHRCTATLKTDSVRLWYR